jgi:hypothetical protein
MSDIHDLISSPELCLIGSNLSANSVDSMLSDHHHHDHHHHHNHFSQHSQCSESGIDNSLIHDHIELHSNSIQNNNICPISEQTIPKQLYRVITSASAADLARQLLLNPQPIPVVQQTVSSKYCVRCERTITTNAMAKHLQQHELYDDAAVQWKCMICLTGYSNQRSLTRHNHISHPTPHDVNDEKVFCSLCDQFISYNLIQRHNELHELYLVENLPDGQKCHQCKLGFDVIIAYEGHLQRHDKQSTKRSGRSPSGRSHKKGQKKDSTSTRPILSGDPTDEHSEHCEHIDDEERVGFGHGYLSLPLNPLVLGNIMNSDHNDVTTVNLNDGIITMGMGVNNVSALGTGQGFLCHNDSQLGHIIHHDGILTPLIDAVQTLPDLEHK